jgi:hypothetical protein
MARGLSLARGHGLLVVGGAATTSPPLRREDYCVTCAVIYLYRQHYCAGLETVLLLLHTPIDTYPLSSFVTVNTRLPLHYSSGSHLSSVLLVILIHSFSQPDPSPGPSPALLLASVSSLKSCPVL